jgi:hypothetical protein
MIKRRAFNLSLPAGDPNSAAIVAWLDAQPEGADVAPELRRLLATAIGLSSRLDGIDRKLDALLQGGPIAAPAPPAAPVGATEAAALDTLFSFDV